jgi:hypothetical protein
MPKHGCIAWHQSNHKHYQGLRYHEVWDSIAQTWRIAWHQSTHEHHQALRSHEVWDSIYAQTWVHCMAPI